jgi:hypothetical protein
VPTAREAVADIHGMLRACRGLERDRPGLSRAMQWDRQHWGN